jgi:hypothetical protein
MNILIFAFKGIYFVRGIFLLIAIYLQGEDFTFLTSRVRQVRIGSMEGETA